MENVDVVNLNSLSEEKLEELYNNYYNKIEDLEDQIFQLEEDKYYLVQCKEIISNTISQKRHEETKKNYN